MSERKRLFQIWILVDDVNEELVERVYVFLSDHKLGFERETICEF